MKFLVTYLSKFGVNTNVLGLLVIVVTNWDM
jgi:hypothetical protein